MKKQKQIQENYIKRRIIGIFVWFLLLILIISWVAVIIISALNNYHFWLIMFLSLLTLDIFFIIPIGLDRRIASSKIGWIMFLVLIPFLSHISFLIMGKVYLSVVPFETERNHWTFKNEKFDLKNKKLDEYSNVYKRGIYKSNQEFYAQGVLSIKNIINDMRNAKKTIWAQFYIIKEGFIFKEFINIAKQKVKEGVDVRLIIDDFGRWSVPYHILRQLKENGIKIAIYERFNFPFIGNRHDFRMHRKGAIIDGKIVHMGGLNLGDEYASLNENYGQWADFGIKITGEAVRSHLLLFAKDWNYSSKEKLNIENIDFSNSKGGLSDLVMIDSSHHEDRYILQDTLTNLISNAKKEINISTPYLAPTEKVFDALTYAAKRGVKVTIYVPGKFDKKVTYWGTRFMAFKMQKYGISVRVISNTFLHSKFATFDEEIAYYGTANIDYRSISFQQETIMLTDNKKIIKKINNEFKYYYKNGKEIETKIRYKSIFWALSKFVLTFFTPMM